MQHIIIIGSRGYHVEYGGFETFVTNLIDNYMDDDTKFHVAELTHVKEDKGKILDKNNVSCLQVYSSQVGFLAMFIYSLKALYNIKKYIRKEHIENPILYVLGCRMGPFYRFLIKPLKKMGAKVYLNPDGLEFNRSKWPWWIKKCFKISYHCMIKNSDCIICDSKAIKEYIDTKYRRYHRPSVFISYGAYLESEAYKDEQTIKIMQENHIQEQEYYLIVGRFIPENNYELIIKSFMESKTEKDLVIVSNVYKGKFWQQLLAKTQFDSDKRIKFIGPIYDNIALRYIRKNAWAYIHGHSVGGTNPSLLESLAVTDVNIIYDVSYNREVGREACLYFNDDFVSLENIIQKVDKLSDEQRKSYGRMAKEIVKKDYTWDKIVQQYKKIFMEEYIPVRGVK